jgi:Ca2+-binding RTX toxin-like protein
MGRSIAAAGDVNADGYSDFVVGLPNYDLQGAGRGAVAIFYGGPGLVGSGQINPSALGSHGVMILGSAPGDHFGTSVAGIGDVNGDGYGDLLVGAPGVDTAGNNAGAAYVISGAFAANGTQILGTPGADTLFGTPGPDALVGGRGNDVLDGAGGIDSMIGGAGDDIFVFDQADRRVDGGSGTDTVRFTGADQHLDLTTTPPHVYTGIEVFDLTGTGDNSLNLNVHNVLNLSDTSNRVIVNGNAGDSVTSTGQGWVAGPDDSIGGTYYHTYHAGAASLFVDVDVAHTIS